VKIVPPTKKDAAEANRSAVPTPARAGAKKLSKKPIAI